MKDPDAWCARDVLRLIGFAVMLAGVVAVFPAVGNGPGAVRVRGADVFQALLLETGLGTAALTAIVAGALVLFASVFVPDDL